MEKLIDTIPRDAACKRLREEKDRQRLTNQDISDRTGIPLSNIGKFFSCTLERPSVYNVAAVCKLLGVSMDELFGISDKLPERTEEKVQAAEEIARHYKQTISVLLAVCALLACTLLFYIVLDKGIADSGLFRDGHTSPIGIAFIILLCGSVAAIVHGITRAMK